MEENILPAPEVDEPEPLVRQLLLDDAFSHSIRSVLKWQRASSSASLPN
jgi:hypothetical protein